MLPSRAKSSLVPKWASQRGASSILTRSPDRAPLSIHASHSLVIWSKSSTKRTFRTARCSTRLMDQAASHWLPSSRRRHRSCSLGGKRRSRRWSRAAHASSRCRLLSHMARRACRWRRRMARSSTWSRRTRGCSMSSLSSRSPSRLHETSQQRQHSHRERPGVGHMAQAKGKACTPYCACATAADPRSTSFVGALFAPVGSEMACVCARSAPTASKMLGMP
mmetsp:Transcript_26235/g.52598  ORF Transcript_26235/g.52598 Transcript_26235/m.52598 type:complete len:221 (-) Transcript_26235:112-774(-)